MCCHSWWGGGGGVAFYCFFSFNFLTYIAHDRRDTNTSHSDMKTLLFVSCHQNQNRKLDLPSTFMCNMLDPVYANYTVFFHLHHFVEVTWKIFFFKNLKWICIHSLILSWFCHRTSIELYVCVWCVGMLLLLSVGCLTLSWWSKYIWVTFHVSRSLVCHLLPVAQWTETSTRKRIFLWYWFQRDVHVFFEVQNHVTLTKYLESNPSHDGDFPFTVRNDLTSH